MIWSQVLVVLLSIILGLFLVVGVILIVMVVKVTVEIKSVTRDTKRTIDNIEQSVHEFTRTAKTVALGKSLYQTIKRKSKKNKEK